jgi:hypothetical protein
MPEHYINRSDWRDRLLESITMVVMIPIAFVMYLLLGEN